MGYFPVTELPYITSDHYVPVKAETSPSPDLISSCSDSLQQYHDQRYSHRPPSHASHALSRRVSPPGITIPAPSLFRFGTGQPAGFPAMSSGSHHWTAGPGLPNQQSHSSDGGLLNLERYESIHVPYSMAFSDDGDEATDVIENSHGTTIYTHLSKSDLSTPGERQVRRRSSKGSSIPPCFRTDANRVSTACDQCRKSKCKCERTTPGEPCRNCVMLGTGE